MVQADADIMLIDEVLAVGDAAFGQKCMDVFHERRRAGKTVVLVTHDMATVQSLCHRAMLIHDGELQYVGDPEDAALRYFRKNFAQATGTGTTSAVPDYNVEVEHARLLGADGAPVENLEEGEPILLDIRLRALRAFGEASFLFQLRREDHVLVATFPRRLEGRYEQGQVLSLTGRVENVLVPGRYHLDCWIKREGHGGDAAVQGLRMLDFVVYGTAPRDGVVRMGSDVELTAESSA
jgi:ABC-2 type transport system ATP-binding protein